MLEKEFRRLNDLLWEIEGRPHPSDHQPLVDCIRQVNHTCRLLARATERLEAKVITFQTQVDFLALEAHILDERAGEDEEVPDAASR